MIKNLFKSLIAGLLATAASVVISKYRPKIVMVTGSVGKTSTKDAIAVALAPRYHLRASGKNFNNDFGVPFTILGAEGPRGRIFGWLQVFKEALALIALPNHYPKLLVLEVGADRPGDLAKILRIVTPDIVVVTRLPEVPVHVEAYASPEAVREEEFYPAYALAAGAPLILACEDGHAVRLSRGLHARVSTYGTSPEASMQVSDVDFYSENERVVGMQATFTSGEESGQIVMRGSVGRQQVLPLAAALETALALGVPFEEARGALGDYLAPAGRGRVFAGKSGSTLIDDTYNASPAAVEEALHTLKHFPGAKRRIAVLGDMLELGRYSVAEHERIGALAAESADVVVGVGIRSRALVERARHTNKKTCDFSYDDSYSAAESLKDYVEEGDVVLIKGSQSIRTERITEALLADPADLSRLVRQESEWKKKT